MYGLRNDFISNQKYHLLHKIINESKIQRLIFLIGYTYAPCYFVFNKCLKNFFPEK